MLERCRWGMIATVVCLAGCSTNKVELPGSGGADAGEDAAQEPPNLELTGDWATTLDGTDTRVSMGRTPAGAYDGILTRHVGDDYTVDPLEVSGTISGWVYTATYDDDDVTWTFSDPDHFTGHWAGIAWTGTRFDPSKRNACGCPVLLEDCSGTVPLGAACTADTDCCTGTCYDGTCYLAVGAACTDANDCESGHCEGQICCSSGNSDCNVTSDCCGQIPFCSNGLCQ